MMTKLTPKQRSSTGKMRAPVRPAMKERRRRSANVIKNIRGQMNRSTVKRSGSGSDLLLGLKIRYDLQQTSLL